MTLKSRLYRDTFENTLLMYNSKTDLKNKKGNYSHYSYYSDGAGLQLATVMREANLLSFAVNWKDDVHREQGARHALYDLYADRTWSTASEYQWMATDVLDVVAGISYDWRDSREGKKYEKNGSITHYDDNSQSAFNWQLMTEYHFDDNDSVSFSYSDRTRFPTLKERYTTSKPAYNQIALVNPQLKPERDRGVDLTWKGSVTPDWGVALSVYHNRVTDAILSHNIDASTIQNQNSGRVDYTGLDLAIKGKIATMVDVGSSYGLIHARPRRQEAGNITDLPNQIFSAWFILAPIEKWSITLSEEARSSSYSNSDGSQKAGGFALTHIRTDYILGHGFSINGSVNNLFDKSYNYSEGYIEEGRNYWLGVENLF